MYVNQCLLLSSVIDVKLPFVVAFFSWCHCVGHAPLRSRI
jgi:hypothetical protein